MAISVLLIKKTTDVKGVTMKKRKKLLWKIQIVPHYWKNLAGAVLLLEVLQNLSL